MNTKEWHENQSWSKEGDYIKYGVATGALVAFSLFFIINL